VHDFQIAEKTLACTARSPARTLDVAKGVLVMLRRCDADEMFMELVEVSRKYTLSAFAVAAALVSAAGGRPDCSDTDAANAVEQEWGWLLSATQASGWRDGWGGRAATGLNVGD
jgi:hypothetical protein